MSFPEPSDSLPDQPFSLYRHSANLFKTKTLFLMNSVFTSRKMAYLVKYTKNDYFMKWAKGWDHK